MITSRQNSKIQFVRSLMGRSKERQAAGSFPAEGLRLVEEGLQAGWQPSLALHTSGLNERGTHAVQQMRERGVDVDEVAPSLMEYISGTENSQGLLAVFPIHPLPIPEQLNFLLAIDAIRDPGNVGTLLRTAAAAGVQAVTLLPDSVDPYAPKVVRSAMGAHFRLPILTLDWDAFLRLTHPQDPTRRLKIFLAEASQGPACWDANFTEPLALIISNEAEGATLPARQAADSLVCIPMPGGIESLNAAIAGAVLMFEVVRQRHIQGDFA